MAKALGLDYGQKRVGVSLSDETKKYAFVYKTLPNDDRLISGLVSICHSEKVDEIIIGLPLDQNGAIGPAAQKVKEFAEVLSSAVKIKIIYEDERFSTTMAAAMLKEAGKNAKQSRQSVDQSAAQIILQTYLDRSSHHVSGI